MTDNPFQPGLPSNLMVNAPGEIPEAPGVQGVAGGKSPFAETLDYDEIIKNLNLNRPLKLYIPNREQYPDWEFRIINSIPGEIADAHNKGFREVTSPEVAELFKDLVAGSDKTGKVFRPVLVARPKKVGEIVRKKQRLQLQSLYAGMDPKNKEFGSSRVENITAGPDASKGNFNGAGWRIKA
jgi:hypothetical protein